MKFIWLFGKNMHSGHELHISGMFLTTTLSIYCEWVGIFCWGAKRLFVCIYVVWHQYIQLGGRITRALKLHRYHVRFQRFIRTNDRGRRNSSSSPLLSSGNSFSIMFWGAVGFICDIEIAFFQYVS